MSSFDSTTLDINEMVLEIDPRLEALKETQQLMDGKPEAIREQKRQMKVPSKSIQLLKSIIEQYNNLDFLEFDKKSEKKEEQRGENRGTDKRKKSRITEHSELEQSFSHSKSQQSQSGSEEEESDSMFSESESNDAAELKRQRQLEEEKRKLLE